MSIEVRDDDIITEAMPAGSWVIGGQSPADPVPTAFGRESLLNYVSANLASIASSGSASDLLTGTVPSGRLHAHLADIAGISSPAQGDILYFDGANFVALNPGSAGYVLTTGGAGANPAWSPGGAGSGLGDLLSVNNLSDLTSPATARTNLGLVIGLHVQAYDADLTTWAGLTPSANAQSLVTAADYAAMRALLDLEAGTDFYSISAADSAISTAVANYTLTTDLAATTVGKGASLIGIQDAGGLITATTVEGALAENRAAIDAIEADYLTASDIATAVFDADIGVTVQAYDADLTSWAGITRAAGFDTFATTPSSANLASLVTDETGSGALVFGTNPTFTTQTNVTASGAAASANFLRTDAHGDVALVGSFNFFGRNDTPDTAIYGQLTSVCLSDNAGAETGDTRFAAMTSGTLANVLVMGFDITPGADNTQKLGVASLRWSEVFAGNATINTSDGTQKTIRGDGSFTADELAAWGDVQPKVFQWDHSIALKGAEAARLNVGYIAQDVEAAFAARGLDARRYALFCEDDEMEEIVISPATSERPALTKLVPTGGKRLGLRYEQCQVLETAYQRAKIEALEAQVAALQG